jgi:hypothetical protein
MVLALLAAAAGLAAGWLAAPLLTDPGAGLLGSAGAPSLTTSTVGMPGTPRRWHALGASPQEVSTGLSAAQVLPALAGAVLGILGGLALFAALSGPEATNPPLWQLLTVVPVTVLVVAALTTTPARLGARRRAAETR